MVVLDPTTHTYIDSDNTEYQSVTRFINKFVPEFDFDQKSKQYASKYGLDVEEVRKSWKLKNKLSTDFGTSIHEQIELSLLGQPILESFNFKESVKSITSLVREHFPKGSYLLEHTVWNKEVKIAGTSDLIVDCGDNFSIIDFKTNKQIKYTNDYESKSLLKPINHLPNGEYFKYALQLSFYAYLYSLSTNKTPYRLSFYWLKRKNNSYEDSTNSSWVRYNVPYLKEEVECLLKHAR
jgi:ATP-dependent exoDNAse (exonuclease V) beta subunit